MATETMPPAEELAGADLRVLGPDETPALFPHLSGRPLALAMVPTDGVGGIVISHDAFDSEVFERMIGRIIDVRASSAAGFAALFAGASRAAGSAGFQQLLRRTPVSNREEVQALGSSGFELMDVGITFARTVGDLGPPPERPDIAVRPATDDDVTAIADGMLHLPWGSRYESDPTYTAEQVRELRTRWLWNSQLGRADVVLVGVIDATPAAFLTCVVDADHREGDIELVGTLPAFRGRGAASHLLAHALSHFSARADLVTVRTQATNFSAARVYERAGFTMHASDLTFRKNLGAAS